MKTKIKELENRIEVLTDALTSAVSYIEFTTNSRGGGAPDLMDDKYTITTLQKCRDALFPKNESEVR